MLAVRYACSAALLLGLALAAAAAAPADFISGGSLGPGASDWSYGTQVPPSDDGAPQHGFCRRIDAGGAVAVRWPAPLPSAGAKVRLRLSGPAPAPGPLDSLSITASLGSGGEGKGAAVVPLSKVLGAGTEGTADAGSIVGGGGPFDQIEIRRAGDGSQVISICVDVLSVTY